MTRTAALATMPPSLDLERYLDRRDFRESIAALADPLGSNIGLPPRVDEIGLVCPNVQLAAEHLERRWPGMRTFLLGAGRPRRFADRDEVKPFTTRVGFGFYRGAILELAEGGMGSDVFTQDNPEGRILVNHVGFFARGPELVRRDGPGKVRWLPRLAEAGHTRRYEAELAKAGIVGHVHIFETAHVTGGVNLEFLDFRLFGTRGPYFCVPGWGIGAIGWLQKKRFLRRWLELPGHADLPPAPTTPIPEDVPVPPART